MRVTYWLGIGWTGCSSLTVGNKQINMPKARPVTNQRRGNIIKENKAEEAHLEYEYVALQIPGHQWNVKSMTANKKTFKII